MKRLVILIAVSILAFTGCASMSPLAKAASEGNMSQVQHLISQGKSVYEPSGGKDYFYPIHGASLNGHAEIVKLLLRYGAAVDSLNFCNQTPLMYTIFGASPGRLEVAKVLISQGANLNAIDCFGWKAYDYAKRNNDKNILPMLGPEKPGIDYRKNIF